MTRIKAAAQDAGHPEDLEAFYKRHPSFIWGPSLIAGLVYGLTNVPAVSAYLSRLGAMPFGLKYAAMYSVYCMVCSLATHGWYCTFVSQERQLQTYEPKGTKGVAKEDRLDYSQKGPQKAGAVRTLATFACELVYAVYPFAPATTSWAAFFGWTCALAIYWDIHFFIVHTLAHENRHVYKYLHKLHHMHKAPGVFSAYFVTYQSHFCTEQSVILLAALCGLPIDVFCYTMYHGALDSFIHHAGHNIANIRLPFMPFTWAQLNTILAPWSLILGGATTAEHDWHHEKFNYNYSLSFTYLDKLYGTFHAGRKAGECLKEAKDAPSAAATGSASDVPSAANGWGADLPAAAPAAAAVVESAVSGVAAESAAIAAARTPGVKNVLRLVEAMKGEPDEIGAPVDMYEHSLQAATRARRAGADTETVVCALLHDIGEVLSGTNHGEIAASVLRPYISPLNHWLLSSREVLQENQCKTGDSKDALAKVQQLSDDGFVAGHPFYDATIKFCNEYDQPSVDPAYDTDSLKSFVPLVEEVFNRAAFWWQSADKPQEVIPAIASGA